MYFSFKLTIDNKQKTTILDKFAYCLLHCFLAKTIKSIYSMNGQVATYFKNLKFQVFDCQAIIHELF